MYKEVKYFEGLDALRFIAAYLVVIQHAEQIRMKYEMFHLKDYSLSNMGGIGVTFFFVLSGFLITYLLIKEQHFTQQISIKKFYIRRILRIWPLYYLLVIIGTILVPLLIELINHPYEFPYAFEDVVLYYIFFLPFMVNIIYGHHLLEPLWSIGVEEIFYIFWAPLVKFLKKNILQLIIAVIVLKLSLLVYLELGDFSGYLRKLSNMLQFEAMAIGGLAAYKLYQQEKDITLSWLFSRPLQIFVFSYILAYICFSRYLSNEFELFHFLFKTPILSNTILMLLFAWSIINISLNKKSIVKMNSQVLGFLGRISYGIYMYHMIVIFTVVLFLKKYLEKLDGGISTIVFYSVLTGVVILVSFISKKYFEDKFLRLKSRYE